MKLLFSNLTSNFVSEKLRSRPKNFGSGSSNKLLQPGSGSATLNLIPMLNIINLAKKGLIFAAIHLIERAMDLIQTRAV
jgi:hypothetical protein